MNPFSGELINNSDLIKSEIVSGILSDYENYILGYIISGPESVNLLYDFLIEYEDYNKCIIHAYSLTEYENLATLINDHDKIQYNFFSEGRTSREYQASFLQGSSAMIIDGFNKRTRNADYPPDEFFTDIHKSYQQNNHIGFGDYSIVGQRYDPSGGPAHAVAIHLTYAHTNGDIRIKHFLSDRKESPVDPGGKFLEALAKLYEFIESGEIDFSYSSSCNEFRDLFDNMHFPGLGVVKKISIKHHIELLHHILS